MNILDIGPSDRQTFAIRGIYRHEADLFVSLEEKFFDHTLAIGSGDHHIFTWH
ncbi:hypothetical protein D3C84_1061540 [compost metagenome]